MKLTLEMNDPAHFGEAELQSDGAITFLDDHELPDQYEGERLWVALEPVQEG